MKDSHFVAEIEIFGGEKGPRRGFFAFPETGLRAVPTEMPGIEGLNTMGIYYEPNAVLRHNDKFITKCRVISEEWFAPAIAEGKHFFVWEGHHSARGVITKLFPENWQVDLPPVTTGS